VVLASYQLRHHVSLVSSKKHACLAGQLDGSTIWAWSQRLATFMIVLVY